jgi:hypothetical protein
MVKAGVELRRLQFQLQSRADPATKSWWENYLKGAIPFRAVKMADISALHDGSRMLETCATNARSPERFAQTGDGRVLRELSHAEPEGVAAFVEQHIAHHSNDAVTYATASSLLRRAPG